MTFDPVKWLEGWRFGAEMNYALAESGLLGRMIMDHEVMRLECMKLAASEGLKGSSLDERAELLYLTARYGRDEAKRLLAERAQIRSRRAHPSAEPIETPMATIYREPSFTDYKPE